MTVSVAVGCGVVGGHGVTLDVTGAVAIDCGIAGEVIDCDVTIRCGVAGHRLWRRGHRMWCGDRMWCDGRCDNRL